MKKNLSLWVVLLLLGTNALFAQKSTLQKDYDNFVTTFGYEPECHLIGTHEDNRVYYPPSIPPEKLSKNRQNKLSSTFTVNYVNTNSGDHPWPADVIDAFDYAVSIWEATLNSTPNIVVEAHYNELGLCSGGSFTLGFAGPFLQTASGVPFTNTFYPIALLNAIKGSDQNGATREITATLNANCDDALGDMEDRWYLGIDGNVPSGKIDFVSVVLHELGHGLGFVGGARYDDGVADMGGNHECDGTADTACIARPVPYLFSQFAEDGNGNALTNTSIYPDPSKNGETKFMTESLANALTGNVGGGVFIDGTNTTSANGGSPAKLFTPSTYKAGSTYSHWDEATYNGTESALMTPTIFTAESVHVAGSLTCGFFSDMGWTIDAGAGDCSSSPLIVDLVTFEGITQNQSVKLAWQTASEIDNAGFEVQHKTANDFETIAFIAGVGNSFDLQSYSYEIADLSYGKHTFRLKQIDTKGFVSYSAPIDILLMVPNAFAISDIYPNPFNPQAHFSLAVSQTQKVTIRVFNVLGQQVATLFDGNLDGNRTYQFAVGEGNWSSGLYAIVVDGENFQTVQKALMMK